MAIADFATLPYLERLAEESKLIRIAMERIATCLEKALTIPEPPPPPEKPLGPESIGEYGVSISDTEGEDAEEIRRRLRESGLTDTRIEQQLVDFLSGQEEGEAE